MTRGRGRERSCDQRTPVSHLPVDYPRGVKESVKRLFKREGTKDDHRQEVEEMVAAGRPASLCEEQGITTGFSKLSHRLVQRLLRGEARRITTAWLG